MALAETTDVATALQRTELTTEEARFVRAQLEAVEARLLTRLPSLRTRTDSDPSYATLVRNIEAEAVARVLRNSEGFRQESIGPWSATLDTRVAAGFLTILDEEWKLLGAGGGAFTITPSAPVPPQWPSPHLAGWA
ncbi:Gp19/Gp15/Gp42 family protein [Pseudonocardia sp. N23]|uniref:Gp19/Gp15/Gp42 family protein n=1 Tax=Pseudonocardia sp. N23 TaxID=1987376 RepID=UPI000BFC13DE|nr:Gp19/Gp15/Gp42 family protein [Pseudonocardia sp. N23]GAY12040.1 phage protein [Pseudonocardia sp. N23]